MSRLVHWALSARAFPYERRTAARAMALLWLVGGATVLLLTFVPHPPALRTEVFVLIGVVALAIGLAVHLARSWLPSWVYPWLLLLGTGAIALLVGAGGSATVAVSLSFAYAWVVMYALVFLRPIVAAAEIAVAVLAYGAVFVARGSFGAGRLTAVEPTVLAAVIATIGAVVLLLAHARRVSELDPLTGVTNRRGLDRVLDQATGQSAEPPEPFTVAVLDVDHFKDINDERGHQAGDRVLTELVARWSRCLRQGDTLARVGGDEFVVLLPGCAPADAETVLERLRHAAEGITCSVGCTELRLGDSGSRLIARADLALYEAKRLGRDQLAWARIEDTPTP